MNKTMILAIVVVSLVLFAINPPLVLYFLIAVAGYYTYKSLSKPKQKSQSTRQKKKVLENDSKPKPILLKVPKAENKSVEENTEKRIIPKNNECSQSERVQGHLGKIRTKHIKAGSKVVKSKGNKKQEEVIQPETKNECIEETKKQATPENNKTILFIVKTPNSAKHDTLILKDGKWHKKTVLRGARFRNIGVDELDGLEQYEELKLQRDYKNKFDPKAIKVINKKNNKQIGYLPMNIDMKSKILEAMKKGSIKAQVVQKCPASTMNQYRVFIELEFPK